MYKFELSIIYYKEGPHTARNKATKDSGIKIKTSNL